MHAPALVCPRRFFGVVTEGRPMAASCVWGVALLVLIQNRKWEYGTCETQCDCPSCVMEPTRSFIPQQQLSLRTTWHQDERMWQGVDSRTVPVRHGRESETIRRRLGSTSRSTWAPRTRGATPTASKRGAGRRTIRPRIQQQDSADGPQEVQHVRVGTAGGAGGSTRSAVSRAWYNRGAMHTSV